MQPDDNPENFNNFNNTTTNVRIEPSKNKYLATVISAIVGFLFIFDGVGQLYLGFYKRFGVETGLSIILNLIGYYFVYFVSIYVGLIVYVISLIWLVYTTYDTYICADALNKGEPIPPLLGRDIQ